MHLRKSTRIKSKRRSPDRSGSLLIIVLVAIVILSLAAYTFMGLMQVEEQASVLQTRRLQSKYLADSGLDYVRLFLSNSEATIREKGGKWNNETAFRGIPVAVDPDNPNMIGHFSIITSSLDEMGIPEGSRFGLTDESSKINLNTLPFSDVLLPGSGREILMTLPNMTEEIADAIMDWLDSDDDLRDYGAETSYYEGQSPAYQAKNGPMDSLDEILLIRGVTPQLLFGLDTNRNGVLDPNEAAAGNVSAVDADMYLGWSAYLTLYSKESNLTAEGLPRININSDNLEQLYDDLKSAFDDDWANYIIYFRCTTAADTIESLVPPEDDDITIERASMVPIDFSDSALVSQRKFDSILDLFDTYIKVTDFINSDEPNHHLESPLKTIGMGLTLPVAMSTLTTYEGTTIPGRINIMQAPKRVLMGIPPFGGDEALVDLIIEKRGSDFELDDPDGADLNRRFETWLLAEGLVDLATMKQLMTYICTGGDVYRAEIVGYFPDGIGTSRAEAVIDTTVPIPRVLFWRDKSHLTGGYSIDTLGVNLQMAR